MCGCGGDGGDGQTSTNNLGGVAAVGSPIVGATIQVKCAFGSDLNTRTDAMGTWQVSISDQILPCAGELSDGTVNGVANTIKYHGVSTTFGTMNMSPLTDLIIGNMAKKDPTLWFSRLNSSTFTQITPTEIDKALANIRTVLTGLTPLATSNPLSATFTAITGNPVDDMLSALHVALTAAGVNYVTLLKSASSDNFGSSVPATALRNKLADAFAQTSSGSANSSSSTLTFNVQSLTYPPQDNLTTSEAQTVTLSNIGREDITIADYTITVPLFAAWKVANTTCPIAPAVFTAGTSCTFSIVFTPTGDDNKRQAYLIDLQFGSHNPAPIPPDHYSGSLELTTTSKANPKISVLLNATGLYPPTCLATQVLQNGICITPPPTCLATQVLQNGICITPPPTCLATQVLQNGVCITPYSLEGTWVGRWSWEGFSPNGPTCHFSDGGEISLTLSQRSVLPLGQTVVGIIYGTTNYAEGIQTRNLSTCTLVNTYKGSGGSITGDAGGVQPSTGALYFTDLQIDTLSFTGSMQWDGDHLYGTIGRKGSVGAQSGILELWRQ
jgi:hypothetical protein